MPYDGLVLAATRLELENGIIDTRIEKIYQTGPREIIIHLHSKSGRMRLLMSAHARNARVHLTNKVKENPSSPPVFCMVLRKHLEGGRIKKITQWGLDRIIEFTVESRDELGRMTTKRLISEIMGKHSNIILVNSHDELILDGINRFSHSVSRHREVLPGRPYVPPPRQDKVNPRLLKEDEFYAICLGFPLNTKMVNVLQKSIDGFSTVMCREIIYQAQLPPDLILDHCGEHELRLLWHTLAGYIGSISQNQVNPSLVTDHKDTPLEYSAFSLDHYGLNQLHGTMNQLLDYFYSHQEDMENEQREKQRIYNIIAKEKNRLKKKMVIQQENITMTADLDKYRLYGELITANIYRLNKGTGQETFENFYEPENDPVVIDLKAELTPSENAQQYFKKYNKAKKTRDNAVNLIEQMQIELDYLDSVENSVEMATGKQELEEIIQELTGQGYLKEMPVSKHKRQKDQTNSRPLSVISSDGSTIYAGKNNRQNDVLTMRMAKPGDLWFHAQRIPGAHVIVKTEGKEASEKTISEAASLAALLCRAKEAQKVPVDYTLRQNISKPGGAKPGYVIYTKQRTIYVNPADALSLLRKNGISGFG